ncbi:helix-turn-helix domain-containing protein [Thiomicrorhabdus sp.]|uniref:helix-turn-helix domain-containing protein n=1 Tax=Thiomicrorhabdus sp. TaxID=2039724 RepID=UPI0029C7B542|nr:helix-turn-helix domain-containing protein [Thiomicrorhabdus sp.]
MTEKTIQALPPLGELLVKAREEQSLSLDAVSAQLNLSVERLEKMESDSFDPANLSPFERGYVRNYAKLLGLKDAEFEPYFANNQNISSDLHSVDRYRYSTQKPLVSESLVKFLVALVIVAMLGFLVWLVWPAKQSASDSPDSIQLPTSTEQSAPIRETAE